MLISPLSIKPSNVYNEKSESCPWSVKQKQTMVWGCWDSGGSRWAVEPGHRVGHRGIQTEEIRGQSSQQRMEERSGAELWEFVIAKCLQRETRGPRSWLADGWCKHGKISSHTQSETRASKRGSLISVWGYIFFSTCASTFIRVWNQHPPSAGKNNIR